MFRHQLTALTLLAAFAFPLAASAQTLPGPQPAAPGINARAPHAQRDHRFNRGRRFMHALHALNLSPAQRQQIAGAMRANERALHQQIDAVLTPDQRTQLRTALAHAHRAPGQGLGAPNPPAQ